MERSPPPVTRPKCVTRRPGVVTIDAAPVSGQRLPAAADTPTTCEHRERLCGVRSPVAVAGHGRSNRY